MEKTKEITGKVLYGLLFVAVLPIILILWAKYTQNIVTLSVPANLLYGWILLIPGAIFVLSGMWSLWRSGKGLPMNAFPPQRFVKNGIYAFTRHPIYL
jgi:protein-S-isoprenylcysteine O-methyltransferase Ste14